MNTTATIGELLVNTIGSLVILVFILRFLLQLVRADFYNPISQFIVKASNPVLVPMRRIIPGYGGMDIASLVLAYAAQVLAIIMLYWVAGQFVLPWINIFVEAPFRLILLVLDIYFWGLIIIVVASWIAPNSYNPALILVSQIVEPVMRPVRRLIPNLGGLDLSPIFLFLGIQIAEVLVRSAAIATLQAL